MRECSVASFVSDSLWPHGLEPARLLCPWNSPSKDTRVGCHALLQGISQPRDQTQVSCIVGWIFTIGPAGKPHLCLSCAKNLSKNLTYITSFNHHTNPTRWALILCSFYIGRTKKRWQEYIELYKKELHDPDNHDGVITHLAPDILECEVKWVEVMELQLSYFKS